MQGRRIIEQMKAAGSEPDERAFASMVRLSGRKQRWGMATYYRDQHLRSRNAASALATNGGSITGDASSGGVDGGGNGGGGGGGGGGDDDGGGGCVVQSALLAAAAESGQWEEVLGMSF